MRVLDYTPFLVNFSSDETVLPEIKMLYYKLKAKVKPETHTALTAENIIQEIFGFNKDLHWVLATKHPDSVKELMV